MMELRLFLEHRFKRTPDGQVWSPIFPYEVWTRYLGVFDHLTLSARVSDAPAVGDDMAWVTGDRVRFSALPFYHGPGEYLRHRIAFRDAVRQAIVPGAAYIVRVPGNVASQAIGELRRSEIAYATEAIADPWD